MLRRLSESERERLVSHLHFGEVEGVGSTTDALACRVAQTAEPSTL